MIDLVSYTLDTDRFMEACNRQFAGALVRLGDDKELFRELISFFREDAPHLLAAIRAGAAKGRKDDVVRAAHSIKGLSANFDAEKAMAIANSIEQMARKGEMRGLSSALVDLEVEVRTLQRALSEYMAQSPSSRSSKQSSDSLERPG